MKPVLKVLVMKECSYVKGKITDDQGNPLEGVQVSAQLYYPAAPDPKDVVTVQGSTITNEKAARSSRSYGPPP